MTAISDDLALGPVDQIGYVVADLDASLPHYEALFGPFETGATPLVEHAVHGQAVEFSLRLAVNRSGPIEIELIQPVEGASPHAEHLAQQGEGLHHVRFRASDLDAKQAQLEAAGYCTVLYKRFGPGLAFAYLATPPALGGSLIELLEMP